MSSTVVSQSFDLAKAINSLFLLLLLSCLSVTSAQSLSTGTTQDLYSPYSSYLTESNSKHKCSYYYSLERTLELLPQEQGFSPESYYLIIVSASVSASRESLPIKAINTILNKVADSPIQIKYYCPGDTYKQKTKIIFTRESRVLLYYEVPNTLNIMDGIRDILQRIVYAQILYDRYEAVEPSLIEIKVGKNPKKVWSSEFEDPVIVEGNTSTLQNYNKDSTINKEERPLSVSMIELKEGQRGNIRNTNSNNDSLRLNNSAEDKNKGSASDLAGFIQIARDPDIVDKGRRVLFVIIILVICIAIVVVLIKYSLEWAAVSRIELNKINDQHKKHILDNKIKPKNFSLARLDLNL